jgi:hypothetical protein
MAPQTLAPGVDVPECFPLQTAKSNAAGTLTVVTATSATINLVPRLEPPPPVSSPGGASVAVGAGAVGVGFGAGVHVRVAVGLSVAAAVAVAVCVAVGGTFVAVAVGGTGVAVTGGGPAWITNEVGRPSAGNSLIFTNP